MNPMNPAFIYIASVTGAGFAIGMLAGNPEVSEYPVIFAALVTNILALFSGE